MKSRVRTPYWMVPAFLALILAPAPWTVSLVLVGAAASVAFRLGRRMSRRRAESRWAARSDTVVLGGDGRGRAVALSDRELSTHGLILGASGAGKSTTLLRILTEQVSRGTPVIAIDMKGSPAFARVLADSAGMARRPFRCWSIDGPAHWNPLQHGNATELKDKLIATERFTEPHYQRAAERYVQTVLRVLRESRPDRAPVLSEVVELMDPLRLSRLLRGVDQGVRERVQDYLAGLTGDQLSAVRGLQTRLAVLTESDTAPYLGPPAVGSGEALIDLRHALAGPEVVLFSLNSSKYGRLAAQIGTLVVQDLVSASGDRLADTALGAPPGLATIGIDEFSALGADHVIALLARGRESGMSVLVATQEMVDLERAAPGLRDQVIGVTAVKVIHRQEAPHSAEMIAQMAGTELVWEETRQTATKLLVGYDTGRGTRREVERFIVHPNEIKNLRTGQAIVISKLGGGAPTPVRVDPPRHAQASDQSRHASAPDQPRQAPARARATVRPPPDLGR